MDFVPLHVYTGYSFLKSGLTIEKYLKIAKKRNLKYLAISDYQTLSGAPLFFSLANKNGLLPIIGEDILYNGLLISAYVENELGYQNLLMLHYLSQKKPLDEDNLKKYANGIKFVASIKQLLSDADFEKKIRSFEQNVHQFYLGLDYGLGEDNLNFLRGFSKRYNYELIAFPHIRYENPSDAIVLKIVEAINNDEKLKETKELGDEYFLTDEDLSSYYTNDELKSTLKFVADKTFNLFEKRGHLLVYQNNCQLNSDDYLKKVAFDNLKKLGLENNPIYINRLNDELKIIQKMGYSDYFLIVSDYVNYAKNNNIYVGPGRGSSAGSVVAYVLGITKPDPLKFNLLFERFLNIDRASMPDIDVDIADTKRYQIIDYLKAKYGVNHVANITTIQTIGAKQSLRDIGRVYDYETREIDLISKTILDANLSLRENYRKNEQFRKLVDSDKYYLNIVSLASKIEGLPRQRGLHAAGIILNDTSLENNLPCAVDEDGSLVSEYEMNYLEIQGFLKMDILGLRNLTIIEDCLNRIKENRHITINYEDIPYDDKDAIKMIHDGMTMGIFQLESSGMKRAIATLEPNDFEDVVALLALFRPGPMDNIPRYARRKKGQEAIKYVSPLLEKILAPTYGIIVYQEQITQIANRIAGFPLSKADIFRSAISKKDSSKLSQLKSDFINGCLKNGVKEKEANEIFALIERFANYGFNRSHSVSYAMIATEMAYLKAHYSQEFYAAILDNSSSKDQNFNMIISEMKKNGLNLSLPNINKSCEHYVVEKETIYYPLSQIKGILYAQVQAIVLERTKNGPYIDFFDFCARTYPYKISNSTITKLIDAGAFDTLYFSRASLRQAVLPASMYAMTVGEYENALELDNVFPKPSMPNYEDNPIENLSKEFELLGVMLSGSQLKLKSKFLNNINITQINILFTKSSDETITLCVLIKTVKKIRTKKGQNMAFILVNDDSGEIELTIFERVYKTCYNLLKSGNIIIVEGYIARKDGEFVVTKVSPLEENEHE